MFLHRYLLSKLHQYLGRVVIEPNNSSISLSPIRGTVEVKNIELRPFFFDESRNICIEGTIKSLTIKLPWNFLYKKQCKIIINEISLIFFSKCPEKVSNLYCSSWLEKEKSSDYGSSSLPLMKYLKKVITASIKNAVIEFNGVKISLLDSLRCWEGLQASVELTCSSVSCESLCAVLPEELADDETKIRRKISIFGARTVANCGFRSSTVASCPNISLEIEACIPKKNIRIKSSRFDFVFAFSITLFEAASGIFSSCVLRRYNSRIDDLRPLHRPGHPNRRTTLQWWHYALYLVRSERVRYSWEDCMKAKNERELCYNYYLWKLEAPWIIEEPNEVACSVSTHEECYRQAVTAIRHYKSSGLILPSRFLADDLASSEPNRSNHWTVSLQISANLCVKVEDNLVLITSFITIDLTTIERRLECAIRVNKANMMETDSIGHLKLCNTKKMFLEWQVTTEKEYVEWELNSDILLVTLESQALQSMCEFVISSSIFLNQFHWPLYVGRMFRMHHKGQSRPQKLKLFMNTVSIALDDVLCAVFSGITNSEYLFADCCSVESDSSKLFSINRISLLDDGKLMVGKLFFLNNLEGIERVKEKVKSLWKDIFALPQTRKELSFNRKVSLEFHIEISEVVFESIALNNATFNIQVLNGWKFSVELYGFSSKNFICPSADLKIILWANDFLKYSPFTGGIDKDGIAFQVTCQNAILTLDEKLVASLELLYDLIVLVVLPEEDPHVYLRGTENQLHHICGLISLSNTQIILEEYRSSSEILPAITIKASGENSAEVVFKRFRDKATRVSICLRDTVTAFLRDIEVNPIELLPYRANGRITISVNYSAPYASQISVFPFCCLNVNIEILERAVVPHLPTVMGLWRHFSTSNSFLFRLRNIPARIHFSSRRIRSREPLARSPASSFAYKKGKACLAACASDLLNEDPMSVYSDPIFPTDLVLRIQAKSSYIYYPWDESEEKHAGILRYLFTSVKKFTLLLSSRENLTRLDVLSECDVPRVRCSTKVVPQDDPTYSDRNSKSFSVSEESIVVVKLVFNYDRRPDALAFLKIFSKEGSVDHRLDTIAKENLFLSINGSSRNQTTSEVVDGIRIILSPEEIASIVNLGNADVSLESWKGPGYQTPRVDLRYFRFYFQLSPLIIQIPCFALAVIFYKGLKIETCTFPRKSCLLIPRISCVLHEKLVSAENFPITTICCQDNLNPRFYYFHQLERKGFGFLSVSGGSQVKCECNCGEVEGSGIYYVFPYLYNEQETLKSLWRINVITVSFEEDLLFCVQKIHLFHYLKLLQQFILQQKNAMEALAAEGKGAWKRFRHMRLLESEEQNTRKTLHKCVSPVFRADAVLFNVSWRSITSLRDGLSTKATIAARLCGAEIGADTSVSGYLPNASLQRCWIGNAQSPQIHFPGEVHELNMRMESEGVKNSCSTSAIERVLVLKEGDVGLLVQLSSSTTSKQGEAREKNGTNTLEESCAIKCDQSRPSVLRIPLVHPFYVDPDTLRLASSVQDVESETLTKNGERSKRIDGESFSFMRLSKISSIHVDLTSTSYLFLCEGLHRIHKIILSSFSAPQSSDDSTFYSGLREDICNTQGDMLQYLVSFPFDTLNNGVLPCTLTTEVVSDEKLFSAGFLNGFDDLKGTGDLLKSRELLASNPTKPPIGIHLGLYLEEICIDLVSFAVTEEEVEQAYWNKLVSVCKDEESIIVSRCSKSERSVGQQECGPASTSPLVSARKMYESFSDAYSMLDKAGALDENSKLFRDNCGLGSQEAVEELPEVRPSVWKGQRHCLNLTVGPIVFLRHRIKAQGDEAKSIMRLLCAYVGRVAFQLDDQSPMLQMEKMFLYFKKGGERLNLPISGSIIENVCAGVGEKNPTTFWEDSTLRIAEENSSALPEVHEAFKGMVSLVDIKLNTNSVAYVAEELVERPASLIMVAYRNQCQRVHENMTAKASSEPPELNTSFSFVGGAMHLYQVTDTIWRPATDLLLSRDHPTGTLLYFSNAFTNHITVSLEGRTLSLDALASGVLSEPFCRRNALMIVDSGLTVTFAGGVVELPVSLLDLKSSQKAEDFLTDASSAFSIEHLLTPFVALGEGSFIQCRGVRGSFAQTKTFFSSQNTISPLGPSPSLFFTDEPDLLAPVVDTIPTLSSCSTRGRKAFYRQIRTFTVQKCVVQLYPSSEALRHGVKNEVGVAPLVLSPSFSENMSQCGKDDMPVLSLSGQLVLKWEKTPSLGRGKPQKLIRGFIVRDVHVRTSLGREGICNSGSSLGTPLISGWSAELQEISTAPSPSEANENHSLATSSCDSESSTIAYSIFPGELTVDAGYHDVVVARVLEQEWRSLLLAKKNLVSSPVERNFCDLLDVVLAWEDKCGGKKIPNLTEGVKRKNLEEVSEGEQRSVVVMLPKFFLCLSNRRSPLLSIGGETLLIKHISHLSGDHVTRSMRVSGLYLRVFGKGSWDEVLHPTAEGSCTQHVFPSSQHTEFQLNALRLKVSIRILSKILAIQRQLQEQLLHLPCFSKAEAVCRVLGEGYRMDSSHSAFPEKLGRWRDASTLVSRHSAIADSIMKSNGGGTQRTLAATSEAEVLPSAETTVQDISTASPSAFFTAFTEAVSATTHCFTNSLNTTLFLLLFPMHPNQFVKGLREFWDSLESYEMVEVAGLASVYLSISYKEFTSLFLCVLPQRFVEKRSVVLSEAGPSREYHLSVSQLSTTDPQVAGVPLKDMQYGATKGIVTDDGVLVLSCTDDRDIYGEHCRADVKLCSSQWEATELDLDSPLPPPPASNIPILPTADALLHQSNCGSAQALKGVSSRNTGTSANIFPLPKEPKGEQQGGNTTDVIRVRIHAKTTLRNETGCCIGLRPHLVDAGRLQGSPWKPNLLPSFDSLTPEEDSRRREGTFFFLESGSHYPVVDACNTIRLRLMIHHRIYEADLFLESASNSTFLFLQPKGERAFPTTEYCFPAPVDSTTKIIRENTFDKRPIVFYVVATLVASGTSTNIILFPRLTVVNSLGATVRLTLWQSDPNGGPETNTDRRVLHSWNQKVASKTSEVNSVRKNYRGSGGRTERPSDLILLGAHNALQHKEELCVQQCTYASNLWLGLSFFQPGGSTEGEWITTPEGGIVEVCSNLRHAVYAAMSSSSQPICMALQPRRRNDRGVETENRPHAPFYILVTVQPRTITLSVGMWVCNMTNYPLLLSDRWIGRRILPGIDERSGILSSQGTPFLLGIVLHRFDQAFMRVGLDGEWSSVFCPNIGASGILESFVPSLNIVRSCNYTIYFPNAKAHQPAVMLITPRWVICNLTSKRLYLHLSYPGLEDAKRKEASKSSSKKHGAVTLDSPSSIPGAVGAGEPVGAIASMTTIFLRPNDIFVHCIGPSNGNSVLVEEDLSGAIPSVEIWNHSESGASENRDVVSQHVWEYVRAECSPPLSVDIPGEARFNLWAIPNVPEQRISESPSVAGHLETERTARKRMKPGSEEKLTMPRAAVTGRLSISVTPSHDNVLVVSIRSLVETAICVQNRMLRRTVTAQQVGSDRSCFIACQKNRYFTWEEPRGKRVIQVRMEGCHGCWYKVDLTSRECDVQFVEERGNCSLRDSPSRPFYVEALPELSQAQVIILITESPVPDMLRGLARFPLSVRVSQSSMTVCRISSFALTYCLHQHPQANFVQNEESSTFLHFSDSAERSASSLLRTTSFSSEALEEDIERSDGETRMNPPIAITFAFSNFSVECLGAEVNNSSFQVSLLDAQVQLKKHFPVLDENGQAFSSEVVLYRALPKLNTSGTRHRPTAVMQNLLSRLGGGYQRSHLLKVHCSFTQYPDGMQRITEAGGSLAPVVLEVTDVDLAQCLMEGLEVQRFFQLQTAFQRARTEGKSVSSQKRTQPQFLQLECLHPAVYLSQVILDQDSALKKTINTNLEGNEGIDTLTHFSRQGAQPTSQLQTAETQVGKGFLLIDHLSVERVSVFVNFNRHPSNPLRSFLGPYTHMLPHRMRYTEIDLPGFVLDNRLETLTSLRGRVRQLGRQSIREQWTKLTKIGTILDFLTLSSRPSLQSHPKPLQGGGINVAEPNHGHEEDDDLPIVK